MIQTARPSPSLLLGAVLVLFAGCVGLEPTLDLAAGVHIDEVAAYQAVERTLVVDGEDVISDVPFVEQRTTLLRVFVTTDGDYDRGPVTALFTVGGEPFEVELDRLPEASDRGDIDSTVNLEVPADLVGPTLDWSVELLQVDGPGANLDARHPAQGVVSTNIEGRANVLRMTLVPYSYEADGSGRMPDTSETMLDELRDRILSVYPVSDVQIDVHEPVPLTTDIGPEYASWLGMTLRVAALRALEAPTDDVYYYGLVNPAETRDEFCSGSSFCIGGIAPVNPDGPDGLGTPTQRIGAGLGYPERLADIAIHELGHAHGRYHAPCTGGNEPPDPDLDYPRDDGMIEEWGWNLITGELHPPGECSDFMGYCGDKHVSAYTWRALHQRSAVNVSP